MLQRKMKFLKRVLIILVSTYSIVNYAYSQSQPSQQKSIISPQIVVLNFEQQRDTLRIPIVSDKYPALKNALSYKNIFDGDDLPDVIKKYQSCGCGITNLDYDVTFESKGIVSIILYFNTMSAYPDDYQKLLTFNISTGERYPIANEINSQGLKWIFNNYKTILRKRIFNDKKENPDENIDGYNELNTTVDSLRSDELFGKYIFVKGQIMFSINKILPHVVQDIEPNRDWLIPYDKLKAYKTPGAIVLK